MHDQTQRNGIALATFVIGFTLLVGLALASTTWAAPNAQGTVPTPPHPTVNPTFHPTGQATAQPTSPGNDGGGNNGGGNNGGGSNGGGDNSGTNGGSATAEPTATLLPPVTTGCVVGENGVTCSDANAQVVAPAGALAVGSILTMEGLEAQPPCPAPPQGYISLNRCYHYSWRGSDGQPVASINGVVQYCMTYGTEQLALTNQKPDVMLTGLAGESGTWNIVSPTLETAGARVCATTNQVTAWSALFAPARAPYLLPITGGE